MFLAEKSSFNITWIILAVVLGLLMGSILSNRKKVDKNKISGLPYKEFMDTKRKGTLVDIRKKEQFEKGKISGAKNCPGKSGKNSIRKDIPIFIYDENGKKAPSVARSYVKNGAVMVYYLRRGYEEYKFEKGIQE